MRKITINIAIALILIYYMLVNPRDVEAAYVAKWSGTSTPASTINPDAINGVYPGILFPYFISTSTSATSTSNFDLSVLGRLKVLQSGTNAVIVGNTTGNVRGSGALDIQSSRNITTQVASGDGSITFGTNNTASALAGIAIGSGNSALGFGNNGAFGNLNSVSGNASFAFGSGNTASAAYSSVFGIGNTASGYANGTALGRNNISSALSSGSAVGDSNTASGQFSSAFGYSNFAQNSNASAMGSSNTASGVGSTASGYYNIVTGTNSSAFGKSNNINGGTNITAFGTGLAPTANNSTAVGPSDAAKLTIISTGRVGISGSSTPSSDLAIGTGSSYIRLSKTATSTYSQGIAIKAGCFQMPDGTCVGSGGGTITGTGSANMLTVWTSATNITASSAPTMANLYATSTTASSTFAYDISGSGVLKLLQTGTNATIIGNVTGNARGANSLDIQAQRSIATQVATGTNAVAIGNYNTAGGYQGFAVGNDNNAGGYRGTASGYANTASSNYASAMGYANLASGMQSTSVGVGNTASGNYSTASGYHNTASGLSSVAIGNANTASAASSAALGSTVNNNTANSTQIGFGSKKVSITSVGVGVGTTTPWKAFSVQGSVVLNGLGAFVTGDSAICQTTGGQITVDTGISSCIVSSRTVKHDIENLSLYNAETRFEKLVPVSFIYDNTNLHDLGLIAEDVAAVDSRYAQFNDKHQPRAINWSAITADIIKVVQDLVGRVSGLDNKTDLMQKQIINQQNQINKMEREIIKLENKK